jgi:uncharacterized protein (TIRG00374 family)
MLAWLALRKVDPHGFFDAFRQSEWSYLLLAGAAFTAAVLVRWLRWWLLFAPNRRPSLRSLGSAFLIGYLFNSVLPGRPGELARAVALKREAGTPVAEALATTAAERIYDVVVLVALVSATAPFVAESHALRIAGLVAGALAALAAAAAVAVGRNGSRLERVLSRLPRVSGGTARRLVASIVHGLASLRDVRLAAVAIVLTGVSWLLLALSAWALLLAFQLPVGFAIALLVVVAANLTLLVPISPAGLGVFEAATVSVLAGFAVDRSAALSYAVALHGLNLFPYLIAGAIALQRHLTVVR